MGNILLKYGRNNSELNQAQEIAVTELPDEHQNFTCEICIEPMSLPDRKFKNQNRCVHPFCIDCIEKYISVKLEDNIGDIPCPSLNCSQFLDPISCRNLLGPHLFVKWCDVLGESSVLGLAQCYCPNRNCSALILNECGENAKRSKCPNCKRLFCFRCKLPWHAGLRCEESGGLRDENDIAFRVLAKSKKWKRCPQCRHFVELNEGCKFVTCRCDALFCYNCGRRVNGYRCDCDSRHSRYLICSLFSFVILFLLFVCLNAWNVYHYTSRRLKN
ncbi:E3 ubiquitin-protein ligase RSL1-like [Nicotiana tabacum]|uniref:RBR-type E3 ubiquitin transferase n=2 Tax=Nicotiana TaxID=4085 RepID=A0A1S4BX59_TOBAC|nr:PREDICTED: probable E3 ubiquitin-protein ligase RNF217 [Nicotiana sylvestris]XP_016493490.1 PREDICTED: probable E3 ubiquitin-protein ligase RNF217 [Nicotiana tabacum]